MVLGLLSEFLTTWRGVRLVPGLLERAAVQPPRSSASGVILDRRRLPFRISRNQSRSGNGESTSGQDPRLGIKETAWMEASAEAAYEAGR